MRRILFLVSLAAILLVPNLSIAEEAYTSSEGRMEMRQELKDRFQERKENLASRAVLMRETSRNAKLEFEEKLQNLKDEKKAQIVARVDANIDSLNKKHTERLGETLEKMNNILGRLEGKVASASALGKDTASASAAISIAKAKISAAQTAVSEQSAKDYTPAITDDATLGSVISQVITTFRKDIQAVHALVIEAKKAVRSAAEAVVLLK